MFVQTKSSLLKNKTGESCKTVIFKSETSRKNICIRNENTNAAEEKGGKELDKVNMKKLRYEIIKFGTSGFDGTKKEESMMALAVALGAKPPKKKSRNYVEILAEKKEKRSKTGGQNSSKSFLVKGSTKRKRSTGKGSGDLLGCYGKVRPNK